MLRASLLGLVCGGAAFASFGRFAGLEHIDTVVRLRELDTYSEGRMFTLRVLIAHSSADDLIPT